MKYIVTLVSGITPSISNQNLQKDAPRLKQMLDEGYSGKLNAGTKISTQDEFISLLPLFGYDPNLCYKGEGSLLAARAGVHLEKDDVAFCCDLVTLKHSQDGFFFSKFGSKIMMENLPFDSLPDEEGKELIREINEQMGTESIVFYPVKNICHLMVWVGGKIKIQSVAPGEIIGKPISPYLPKGDGANVLIRCMEVASQFLQQHSLNEERISEDKPPANGLWLSRPGKEMDLAAWEDLYGLRGTIIAEDDLIQGIGRLAGFTHIDYKETENQNFKDRCDSKAKAVVKSLAGHDFVFVHIPVGKDEKGESLQAIDQLFIGPVIDQLGKNSNWRLLYMESSSFADFPRQTIHLPIEKEISFVIYSPCSGKKSGVVFQDGHLLMPRFIKGGPWD